MDDWEELERRHIRMVLQSARRPDSTAKFPEIELALVRHIASAIPERVAIDAGAFRGSYLRVMRECGFKTFAFEPVPARAADLRAKWRGDPDVEILRVALSNEDGFTGIHLGQWMKDGEQDLNPGDVFNTLELRPWTEELHFPATLTVVRRRLAWFVENGVIPREIGILKVDAEGHDAAVLEGAWPFFGRVMLCEYWNRSFSMSHSGSVRNDLPHYQDMFASRTDLHALVIGRDAGGEPDIFFQVNPRASEANSWGNIFFTKDIDVFTKAVRWCMDVMGPQSCRA